MVIVSIDNTECHVALEIKIQADYDKNKNLIQILVISEDDKGKPVKYCEECNQKRLQEEKKKKLLS